MSRITPKGGKRSGQRMYFVQAAGCPQTTVAYRRKKDKVKEPFQNMEKTNRKGFLARRKPFLFVLNPPSEEDEVLINEYP
ncbi:hypothetical protein [Sphingobacterium sp. HMA12]|uniref:hypothetical protein n=1 Tax=Sphingobacterium sp. HMA12 TaxID=2050894 RepID=UPI000CEA27A1|nr:hypothetical protein [Sphingobacterium sp. HMA12]